METADQSRAKSREFKGGPRKRGEGMPMLRPATAEELPEEQAMFKAAWGLLKKYRYITRDEAGPWTELISDLDRLSGIGQGGPCGDLSCALAKAIADYLEAQSRTSTLCMIERAGRIDKTKGGPPAAFVVKN